MYYRIRDNIAVRSWMFVPAAYYRKGELPAYPLSDDELDVIKKCDSKHDLPEIDGASDSTDNTDDNLSIIRSLLERGVIERCDRGEVPSEWSKFRMIPHRHFPKMNYMITGRCNYNCIHCFNAADNAPLMSEWKYEDALNLLDQAADAGIHALTITGGEPMVHPHFMDIMRAVHERGMYVEELNTNGHFITEDMLDEFRSFGCDPFIKISFDGLGCHDWIRNRKGAQEHALKAIELCVKKGFHVMVQMQVNLRNEETLFPTAVKLNEIGVEDLRLIRTTEVARWREHAPDACIPLDDYYRRMPVFAKKLCDHIQSLPQDKRHLKKLIIWQLLNVYTEEGTYEIYPVRFKQGAYRDTYAVCQGNRGMIAVASNGDMVPCMQMSGYFLEHGINLGNLHEKSLKELLSDSSYLTVITKNLYMLKNMSKKCKNCALYEYCGGGCRALALLYTGDECNMWGEDPAKCMFFEGGFYQSTVETLEGLENLTVISDEVLKEFEDGSNERNL